MMLDIGTPGWYFYRARHLFEIVVRGRWRVDVLGLAGRECGSAQIKEIVLVMVNRMDVVCTLLGRVGWGMRSRR